MKSPSDDSDDRWERIRDQIIGLKERSVRKSYYPELRRRLSELELFRQLLDQTYDLILIMEMPMGRITDANRACVDQLGFSREELFGMSVRDLAPRISNTLFGNGESTGGDIGGGRPMATVFRQKSGDYLPVEASVRMETIDDAVVGVVIARDIRQRLAAEEAWRESKEHYRLLFENATEAIFIIQNDILRFPNPKLLELMGYTADELAAKPFWDWVHPDDRDMVRRRFNRRIRGETASETNVFRVLPRNQAPIWAEISSVAIEWDGQPVSLNFGRNITTQRQLEENLRQSQKMEAIGMLAGGIAHDFNNILSAIIGYTELSIYDLPTDSMLRGNLENVLRAGRRARDLVQQILSISRKSEPQLRPVEIQPVVKEAVKLLRSSLPSFIRIRDRITPDTGVVMADPTQVHQILMNLATNAAHAMEPDGGELTIALDRVDLDEDFIALHQELKSGPHLRLQVADTGCGIAPENLPSIFDPYFTTKEIGRGTGMGLAVVRGIVKRHGGEILVESAPGRGTVFDVYLPMVRVAAEPAAQDTSELAGGSERILFVDDESALVEMWKQLLQRLGYRIEGVSDSLEALQQVQRAPQRYDLVITDMTMPEMPGDVLIERLLALRPDLPIILCTGFSSRISELRAKTIGARAFLMKPLTLKRLAVAIRNVLDHPNPLPVVPAEKRP